MEPQQTPIEPNFSTNVTNQSKLTEVIAPLHRVTPLSKILAAVVMIVLPFAGFWVGYTYAPGEVVKVPALETVIITENTESEAMSQTSSSSESRRVLSRAELIQNEVDLALEFNIDITSPSLGTAPLYFAKDQRDKDDVSLLPYYGKGLSLLLPYDEGQGWPYYKLTPFDEFGDSISFGNIDPCPAGCLGTGGRVSGKINFYEQKSRSEISAKFIKDNNNIATCSEVIIGKNLYGDFCSPDDEVTFGSKALIVEGKNYSYEIIGLGCDDYFIGKYPNLATQTKCESIIDSIKVE